MLTVFYFQKRFKRRIDDRISYSGRRQMEYVQCLWIIQMVRLMKSTRNGSMKMECCLRKVETWMAQKGLKSSLHGNMMLEVAKTYRTQSFVGSEEIIEIDEVTSNPFSWNHVIESSFGNKAMKGINNHLRKRFFRRKVVLRNSFCDTVVVLLCGILCFPNKILKFWHLNTIVLIPKETIQLHHLVQYN